MAGAPKKTGVVRTKTVPKKSAVFSLPASKATKSKGDKVQVVKIQNKVVAKMPVAVSPKKVTTPPVSQKKVLNVKSKSTLTSKLASPILIKNASKKSETTPVSKITSLQPAKKQFKVGANPISKIIPPLKFTSLAKRNFLVGKIPFSFIRSRFQKKVPVSILETTKGKSKKTALIGRREIVPAIRSPFRFPILPPERHLATTARVAGVFLVIAGAFFSLLNLQYATGVVSSIAHTQFALLPTSTSTPSGDGSLNIKPDPVIQVDDGTTIIGMASINVTLPVDPLVMAVKLFIEEKSNPNNSMHYPMVNTGNGTWKYDFDSVTRINGEYIFRFYIQNSAGTYAYTNSTVYSIENVVPYTTTTPTATASTTATTTSTSDTAGTTTISTTAPTISLRILETAPVSGGVALQMFAHDAKSIKVYAKNTTTLTPYFIGYATVKTNDEWSLSWNSSVVPDGKYALRAIADFNGQIIESSLANTEVDNVDETSIQKVSSTTSTQIATSTTSSGLSLFLTMKLSKSAPLSGFVDANFESPRDDIEWIETYAQQKSALTPQFLGIAKKTDVHTWKFTWDTRQSPNGDYDIFNRVKTAYGYTNTEKVSTKIFNEVLTTYTPVQETKIVTITKANDSLVQITDGTNKTSEDDESSKTPEYVPQQMVYIQPVSSFMETLDINDSAQVSVQDLLITFRAQLTEQMNAFAKAQRANDEDEVQKIKATIEALKQEVIQKLPANVDKKEIIDKVNEYVSHVIFELEELTIKNETLLKERVGDAISVDSDKDGISDFDEINIYHTNPFSADTDGDSYIDSAEITLGYNPLNSKSEVLVTYESPKDTGIVRDDLLSVEAITTITEINTDTVTGTEKTDESKKIPRAIFSGTGLPNSFVTLYIYSTPIVVTVKTDENGSWSYVFDKELENGQHEVYVGITDNVGRIVAKSNPLPFVKTAEAFTRADSVSAAAAAQDTEPNMFSSNIMLLVASIAIAALGLVLILLGIHVKDNRKLIEADV
jgi:hypothetical protein